MCMLEIAHNKLIFSGWLWKYGPNNILKVLENPSAAFQEIRDGVQNGRHLKNISCMLEITNKQTFSKYLRKYGQNNILKFWKNLSGALKEIQDGVQNGHHLKKIVVYLQLLTTDLNFRDSSKYINGSG